MHVLKLDLTQDRWESQTIVIKLNYAELSKIANKIYDMEVKDESDAMLKWQMAALHNLCHDRGIVTNHLPAHVWPDILEQVKEANKKNKKNKKK